MSFGELQKEILEQIQCDLASFRGIAASSRSRNHLNGRLAMLESMLASSKGYHEEIMGRNKLEKGLNKSELAEIYVKIREIYLVYRTELLDALDTIPIIKKSSSVCQDSELQSISLSKELRLPPINIPTFAGSYTAWRAYHDVYVSLVHTNQSLSDVQKLHHLKSSLSGDAERLIQHLSLEADNYAKAWELLLSRYDQKRILVKAQLKSFFGQPSHSKESASSVKAILDRSNECIHALENLGLPVSHWDTILIHVLVEKLPSETQQRWEETLGSSKDLPTLKKFFDFLEMRFRTLESISHAAQAKPKPEPHLSKSFFAKADHTAQFRCKACQQDPHSLRKCRRFLEMSTFQRQQIVRQLKVCENCLAYSHATQQCPSARRCYFCQRRHHSLLHKGPQEKVNTLSGLKQTQTSTQNTETHTQHTTHTDEQPNYSTRKTFLATKQHNTNQVLLATALVSVKSADGSPYTLRALIDPGSEATFLSEGAAQLLKLKRHRTFVEVSGLGKVSSGATHNYVDLAFESRHSTFRSATRAFIFKSLTGLLPAQELMPESWSHLQGIQLADPGFFSPGQIDILFGMDVYTEIILPDILRSSQEDDMPIAQKTHLGWVIFGKVPDSPQKKMNSFHQVLDLTSELQKFWEIEETPFQTPTSKEDQTCEDHFVKNTRRLQDGRYEVALPFKEGKYPELGESREIALKRLHFLERRFLKNPIMASSYKQCIAEYVTLRHMEEIEIGNPTLASPHHFYLPHHAVIKESSSTTKLRVVFDAAAKTTQGSSLNDHLLTGPKLQIDIPTIILRWRRYKYSFTADIEKMYRQIMVRQPDSYYQMILWRDTEDQSVKHFRLNTVTFGTACAPYLAIRVLHQAARDEERRFPKGASTILSDMYVDDLISGANTIADAQQKQAEVRNILSSAGFHLRKWTSNHPALLEGIPTEDCEQKCELPWETENNIKTLGVRWSPHDDSFCFENIQPKLENVSKRSMLSSIAKMYDPLGWLAPCIVSAKLMMQQLWKKGNDWDEPIPKTLLEEWQAFCKQLPELTKVKFPRWINTGQNCKGIQIHGFCDASERAYAATVYLRVLDADDRIHMCLLLAKTKVAPLKTISLPRLELCGAVMLATLLHYVKEVLQLHEAEVTAWTDSMITLAWIRAPPSKWATFVSNRVSEIQRLTDNTSWRHIPTDLNPADLASRGASPASMSTQILWWKGPSFLHEQWVYEAPQQPGHVSTEEEARSTKKQCAFAEAHEPDDQVGRTIERTSLLSRLRRVLAFCYRFGKNCRKRQGERTCGPIGPEELHAATRIAIKTAQNQMFPVELQELKDVKTPKHLKTLHPFIDGHGILRVGGRLQNSNLPFEQRHPAILKPGHQFTELVVRDAHIQTLHGGVQQMLGYIHTAYWILRGRNCIKKYIHKCNTCFRQKAKAMEQLMGSLPAPRVQMSRPFSHTGVDYAGPIEVKTWKGRGAKSTKGYFAIFICLATKAVHLEAVTDLTSQAFIAAFRRFTSRRGNCTELHSDCGTNFVGADSELRRMLTEAALDWPEIADTLCQQGTRWKFIPPASPHFGGLWEAGVKSVKHHLRRVVGNEKLTFEEFSTLLSQIEACLNSRPLCPLSDNPEDLEAITPAHFLIGEPLRSIPQAEVPNKNASYLDRWKRIQMLLNAFWKKWSVEYLSRLQQRPKWKKEEVQPKVGNLVLIKDERLPSTQWMLGRIQETHEGNDDLVRVVTLKTRNGTIKRPITKICLLPSNETTESDTLI